LQFLKDSFERLKPSNIICGYKLVRGAYMEKERKRAVAMNYTSPIQISKEFTDRDYNSAVDFCLNNITTISFCVASHNEYSNKRAAEEALKKNIEAKNTHLNFSQLLGMSDNITFNLAKAGFNVTKYVPYGPVKDVVPYLMRRAQENTSVSGQSSRELLLIKKELERRKK
jgi:proline dehydrogenase